MDIGIHDFTAIEENKIKLQERLKNSIQKLNPSQKEAVYWNTSQNNQKRKSGGSAIVLAAAGSGKTTVLTLRIANLLANESNLKPNNILAVTFTNKAANEMKERISHVLNGENNQTNSDNQIPNSNYFFNVKKMWIGTFHSVCYRILLNTLNNTNDSKLIPTLKKNFSIIDSTEQKNIVKKVIKNILYPIEQDDNQKSISNNDLKFVNILTDGVVNLINDLKENCIRAKDIPSYDEYMAYSKEEKIQFYKQDHFYKIAVLYSKEINGLELNDEINEAMQLHFKEFYTNYELICSPSFNNCADFAELLLATYELLNNPKSNILDKYSKQFKEILVDEFQDTNLLQYKLITLLGSHHKNLFVVGDDDQSIYTFRGAIPYNFKMLEQNKIYKPTVIKVEQNYRSKDKIVSLANTLIQQNGSTRMGKNIIATRNSHDDDLIPSFRALPNSYTEARYIAQTINNLWDKNSNETTAILYRTNTQSRVLEQELLKNQIPYIIHGGLRFFDREEIKHAISYFKITNALTFEKPTEIGTSLDTVIQRIINIPARGIGDTTLDKIESLLTAFNRNSKRKYNLIDVAVIAKTLNQSLDNQELLYADDFPQDLIEKLKKTIFKTKKNINNFTIFHDLLLNLKKINQQSNNIINDIQYWFNIDKQIVESELKKHNADTINDILNTILLNGQNNIINLINNAYQQIKENTECNENIINDNHSKLIKELKYIFGALQTLNLSVETNNEYHKEVIFNEMYVNGLRLLISISVHLTGILEMYHAKLEEAKIIDDDKNIDIYTNKIENLQELINSVDNLEISPIIEENTNDNPFYSYINEYLSISTLDGKDMIKEGGNVIHLMTIHASKGLEFNNVFICGFSDELLPHKKALMSLEHNPKAVDEERRLAYVAITRAKDKLFITHANEGGGFYNKQEYEPSMFLNEILPEKQNNNLIVFEN